MFYHVGEPKIIIVFMFMIIGQLSKRCPTVDISVMIPVLKTRFELLVATKEQAPGRGLWAKDKNFVLSLLL